MLFLESQMSKLIQREKHNLPTRGGTPGVNPGSSNPKSISLTIKHPAFQARQSGPKAWCAQGSMKLPQPLMESPNQRTCSQSERGWRSWVMLPAVVLGRIPAAAVGHYSWCVIDFLLAKVSATNIENFPESSSSTHEVPGNNGGSRGLFFWVTLE